MLSDVLFVQEKKQLKEEKLKNEEKYMFALVDGVKEQVRLATFYGSWCNLIASLHLSTSRRPP